MTTCAYIIGTFNEVPGTDQQNFAVLGTYPDKDSAKAAIGNLAPAMMQDQYKNGISLYKLADESKVYTFQKKDLQHTFEEIQKQQQQQLEQQVEQLKQQQDQIQKQIENLKSGPSSNSSVAAPGNAPNVAIQAPAPVVAPTITATR